MTHDERTALNEAVCKRLGWVRLDDYHWQTIGAAARAALGQEGTTDG